MAANEGRAAKAIGVDLLRLDAENLIEIYKVAATASYTTQITGWPVLCAAQASSTAWL
jgi:hypothetical protein